MQHFKSGLGQAPVPMPRAPPQWSRRQAPTHTCACGWTSNSARHIELHAATCRWRPVEYSDDSSTGDSDGHWQDMSDSESEQSREDREAAACHQHFYAWYPPCRPLNFLILVSIMFDIDLWLLDTNIKGNAASRTNLFLILVSKRLVLISTCQVRRAHVRDSDGAAGCSLREHQR